MDSAEKLTSRWCRPQPVAASSGLAATADVASMTRIPFPLPERNRIETQAAIARVYAVANAHAHSIPLPNPPCSGGTSGAEASSFAAASVTSGAVREGDVAGKTISLSIHIGTSLFPNRIPDQLYPYYLTDCTKPRLGALFERRQSKRYDRLAG